MKHKFVDTSITNIIKYNAEYTELDIEKLKYGLEGLYLFVTKLIIIYALAAILRILPLVLAISLLFGLIRFTAFGFHAGKSSHCFISSTIMLIFIPLLFSHIDITLNLFLIIGFISLFIIALYAPADTEKRPLKNKKKRIIRKIISIIISTIYIFIGIFTNHDILRTVLTCALLLQAIAVHPIIYWIFGQPYRNYKNYNQT